MSEPAPKVSVLLPVYNAEDYIEAALDSILAQTFRDFECIVINDGSTDRSSQILDRMAAQDKRVRLVHRSNQGYSRCLNQAMEMARGNFFARMDADDESLPKRFETQLQFLETHPEIVAVSGQWIRIDPKGRVLSTKKYLPTGHEAIMRELLKGYGILPHPAVMMRAGAVRRVGGYRVEFEPAEDLDLWLRLSEVGQLANLDQHVLRYRLHPKATSSLRREEQREVARRAVVEARERRGEAVAPDFRPALSQASDLTLVYADWSRMAMEDGRFPVATIYAIKVLQRGAVRLGAQLFRDIVRHARARRAQ